MEIEKSRELELDTQKKLFFLTKDFNSQLAFHLALADHAAGDSMKYDEICQKFGITRECLDRFRREHRQDTERCKDELFYSKKKIDLLVDQRAILANAYTKALLEGNKVEAVRLELILSKLKSVLSMDDLEQMKKVIGSDDQKASSTTTSTQVNIQVNPALQKAEEALRLRQSRPTKVVDVTEEKK